MALDDGSGHPGRSRAARTWPALDVDHADPPALDLIHAVLLDFGVAAIDDTLAATSRVFFNDDGDRDRAADAVRRQFPGITIRAVDIPDEDWAARSQASLRAVEVGGIVVAPPWDVFHSGIGDRGSGIENTRDPGSGIRDQGSGIKNSATGDPGAGSAKAEPIVIVIQPSMGFGTGHHATTRLCLAALQRVDLRGRRVIDVGTGSGVLAIAASRLGADTVVAIDDDADAVGAALENLELNPEARVELSLIDLRAGADPETPPFPGRFDVVVANLTGGLLVAAAPRLNALAAPAGRLVLSGLMQDEESAVLRAFSGREVEWRGQEDEWICLELAPDRK